jgi:serine/threonine protein kinase/rRNA-processing protein FCF1
VGEKHILGYFNPEVSLEEIAKEVFERLLASHYEKHLGVLSAHAANKSAASDQVMHDQLNKTLSIVTELKKEFERINSQPQPEAPLVRNNARLADTEILSRPLFPSRPEDSIEQFSFDSNFVSTYKMFVDTDSLMHKAAPIFFESYLSPILKKADKELIISERSIDFLKEATSSIESHIAKSAKSALSLLMGLQKEHCVTDCKDPFTIHGDRFATNILFKELFVKYQFNSPLCLITQNASLAEQILVNSRSAAFQKAESVVVAYFGENGIVKNWAHLLTKAITNSPSASKDYRSLEEKISSSYKVIADTSSLMLFQKETELHAGEKFFLARLLPLFTNTRNSLIIPLQVTAEIQKHTQSTNKNLASQARIADSILQSYLKSSLLEIGSEENETKTGSGFADQAFVRIAIRFADTVNICFITQDRELARTLLANQNPSGLPQRHDFLVTYIHERSEKLADWERRLAKEIANPNDSVALKQQIYDKKEFSPRPKKDASLPTDGQKVTDDIRQLSKIPATTISEKREVVKVAPFLIVGRPERTDSTLIKVAKIPVSGDEVLSKYHGLIKLLGEVAAGGEGTIYRTSIDGLVCKIYHEDCLTQARKSKLELMLSRKITITGVCWPTDILTTKDDKFVGYLMPLARGKILKTSVFAGPLLKKHFPSWTRLNLTRLAISVLKTIDQLHDLNIFIGDINPQNILVFDDWNISVVDTDSFQIQGFPCPVGTDTFTPPERQGQNFETFIRTKDDELFAVTTLLFMLLFPGKSPYSAQGGGEASENIKNRIFPYANQEDSSRNIKPVGAWQFIWSHLHPDLKNDFLVVFHKGKRVEIGEMIKHLFASLKDIESGKRSNEILPKQPRLQGTTVTAICELCNKPEQISESLANRYDNEGTKFRHSGCNDIEKLKRLATTREIPCELCGEIKTVPLSHLEKLNVKGRSYFCQDCNKKQWESRGGSTRGRTSNYGNNSNQNNSSGSFLLFVVIVIVLLILSQCHS